MSSNKQLFLLLVLILLTLFLRDLPYVNVIFINRMWLIYFAILFFVFLTSIKFRVTIIWYVTFGLFFIAFILTFMRLHFFAESIGVLIYFALWTIVIHKLIEFIKDRR